ncbi:MAG: prepilin-type N-terminal cleavage/methylation domain-containing protein [Sedimentisphaerales bacterium]|nr:prepilin-type N-terminal cleavage/methylation domain-containing protein [Sedimentisphaerales bacterium]
MYKAGKNRFGKKGYTLLEALVAVIIIGILVSVAAPIYKTAVEQARLDSAAGNLKTIWSAQRAYWLKHRTFADNLAALETEDLVSVSLEETQISTDAKYVYDIDMATADTFTASAVRSNSSAWDGDVQINELGQITGSITHTDGLVLSPQTLE